MIAGGVVVSATSMDLERAVTSEGVGLSLRKFSSSCAALLGLTFAQGPVTRNSHPRHFAQHEHVADPG